MRRFTKKTGCILLIAAPFVLYGVCLLLDAIVPSVARRALPASATDIHEYYTDSGIAGQDFTRYLKAKVAEADIATYAAKLGLKERYTSGQIMGIPISFTFATAPDWWNPPASREGAYFHIEPGGGSYEIVGYHDGYLYFMAESSE